MFARLVYNNPGTTSCAQTIFATVVNILTGTTTANTQLDPTVFNRSASYIVNGAGAGANTGWTVIDSQANLVANAALSSNPVVIGSPWSDSSFYGKYLYLAPTIVANTVLNYVSVPMDGWQANTKSTANGVYTGGGGTIAYTNLANVTASGIQLVFNSSNGVARWYDFLSSGIGILTSQMHTTILSSSNTHLLVANFVNLTGSQKPTPMLSNYFFLSEYSRDDAWNTAASGFPSWYAEGASLPGSFMTGGGIWNGYAFSNVNNSSTYGHAQNPQAFGVVAAYYISSSNTVGLGLPMYRQQAAGTEATNSQADWGISTRFFNWGATSFLSGVSGSTTTYIAPNSGYNLNAVPPYSRGLFQAANIFNFLGNQNLTRDINKNPAIPIAELRLTSYNLDTTWQPGANSIWSGGSISGPTPYIYATSSRFKNFDEITLGGNTYMVINFNNNHLASTPAPQYTSNMLILER